MRLAIGSNWNEQANKVMFGIQKNTVTRSSRIRGLK